MGNSDISYDGFKDRFTYDGNIREYEDGALETIQT